MQLKKAFVKDKKVFLQENNIEIPDCIIFGKGGTSEGIILIDNENFYYIPLQTNNWDDLLDEIIKSLNQIATSVSSSTCVSLGAPIATSITTDIQTNIQKLQEIKNNLV